MSDEETQGDTEQRCAAGLLLLLAENNTRRPVTLHAIESAIRRGAATCSALHAFRGSQPQQRLIQGALALLERRSHVRRWPQGYEITHHGAQAAVELAPGHIELRQLAQALQGGLQSEPPPRSRMQQAVDDMRRGRPPRWG